MLVILFVVVGFGILHTILMAILERTRELGVVLADAVLRNMGGRARLAPRRRGNQVELSLPAVRAPSPGVRRPRAGRGAPRRP